MAIYLYGSALSGSLREESDIDVAFLPERAMSQDEKLGLVSKIEGIFSSSMKELGLERQISVLALDGKYVPLTLQYKVVTEGVPVFTGDKVERVAFENTVKSEYFDFMPFLRSLREKKYGTVSEEVRHH